MAIFREVGGNSWHAANPPTGAWFKRPTSNVFITPDKLLRNIGGSWQEVWPLVPNTVPSLAFSQQYNTGTDQIEWTFTWGTPTANAVASAAVTNYTVAVNVNGSLYNSYTITVGTNSMVLTGGGTLHTYSGQAIYFTVTANSQYGAGPTSTSSSSTCMNLPAPPSVTSLLAAYGTGNIANVSFNHAGGRRVTSFSVTIYFHIHSPSLNGSANKILAGSTSVFNSFIGYVSSTGDSFYFDVYAIGPGGNSATVTSNGVTI